MAPSSLRPFLASPIFSWRGKLRMIMDLFLPTKDVSTDESLEDFVVRRLGREAFDRMAQPMIGGIYSANPKKLSLQATMPQFLQLEQKYGSIIRALMETMSERSSGARYGIFRTFDQGIQVLVNELLKKLPVGMVETGSMVTKITKIMKPEKNDDMHMEETTRVTRRARCPAATSPSGRKTQASREEPAARPPRRRRHGVVLRPRFRVHAGHRRHMCRLLQDQLPIHP